MGFRINTNIAAMNAHSNSVMNNRNIDDSLSKLSSGLRINKAADDASGMAIADSLRSQASALGQAITNANDAIGIIQIADKAMDEQLKILDTIKVKATQAAQDGQSAQTRKALQADINRLMEQLDNIAEQTSYNGQSLLNGSFTNKEFQVGAYSNQTIKATIGNTASAANGSVRYESFTVTEAASNVVMSFSVGGKDIDLAEVDMRWSVDGNRGLAALADVINKNSDITGVRAGWEVKAVISEIAAGGADVTSLKINGVYIGTLSNVAAGDADGELVNAINAVKQQTGVEAYIDSEG
ncbi:MAG: flagellin B, partial [Epsilonproteobacteria bacterium]|nr:flagellin B [Campylobacterota bacterium]